jgi:hypothetical protein
MMMGERVSGLGECVITQVALCGLQQQVVLVMGGWPAGLA